MVAGAKLRAAFAPQVAEYTLMGREIGRSLWITLLAHAAAAEEYKIFVHSSRQGDYQKVWEDYYKSLQEKGGPSGPYQDNKIYIERIEAILKFTEPN